MKGLELTGAQSTGAAPSVKGVVKRCHNLSERGDGTLQVVMPDKVMARLQGRPVGCARRDDRTCLFTQDDDGTLREACRLSDGNEAEYPGRVLACLEERVVQGQSIGEFMVFRCGSGRLLYARQGMDGYEWLGGLPDAPRFELRAESEIEFEGRVAPVGFKGTVGDLRPGLDTENLSRVDMALKAGLADAIGSAARSGYRVMPVMVRLAWRLWDGSLLHVSEAQRISGAGALPGSGRVMLPLAASDKGFTGTGAGSVSVDVYRLKVIPGDAPSSEWSGVLQGIEVWVSHQGDCLREGGSVQAAYYQGNGSAQLACNFPVRREADVEAELPGLSMSRQLVITDGGEAYVPVDEDAELSMEMTGSRVPSQSDAGWLSEGDALLAYGGFLHVASGDCVRTSQRGNPFVTQSVTCGVGGVVKHMWPQLRGGGAYTRQYLYLATAHGIVALTHDRDGNHTNCRLISPVIVAGEHNAVATSGGLIAAGAGGEVVCVRDAKVELLQRHVGGIESVMYSAGRGWIMLCGSRQSLVLQEDADMRGFTRSFVMKPLGDCLWRGLGWYESRLGEVSVYDPDSGSEGTPPMDVIWQGVVERPSGKGGEVRRLRVPVGGDTVMAQLQLRVGRDSDWLTVSGANVSGQVVSGVRLRCLAAGSLSGQSPDYELTVAGCFFRLGEVGWD